MKRRKEGFTLAELLIVVAIIAVLAAIAIPIFSAQLAKAKAAADTASVRNAKAVAAAQYLTDEKTGVVTYYYDQSSSAVTTDAAAAKTYKGYGQSTTDVDEDNATGIPLQDGVANIVAITIEENGSQTATWVSSNGSGSGSNTALNGLTAKMTANEFIAAANTDGGANGIAPGTLVKDGDSLYLVYGYQSNYTLKGATTMDELVNKFPTNIEKVSDSLLITQQQVDSKALDTYTAGSIILYNGKYYSLTETVNNVKTEWNPVPGNSDLWKLVS